MSSTEIIPAAEALEADWANAQTILDATDRHQTFALLGQILLGWQLHNIKTTLGFQGPGKPSSSTSNNSATVAELRGALSWREHVEANLRHPGTGKKFASRTADRYIQAFIAAKSRLRKLGEKRALLALSSDPHALDPDSLAALREAVVRATDGMLQKELLEDGGYVKRRVPPPGHHDGHGLDGDDPPLTARQLAFAYFEPLFESFGQVRADPIVYRAHLAVLPLKGDPGLGTVGLRDLEHHLVESLRDVRDALKRPATA